MKHNRILTDPGFWVLAGINVYLVYHYYQHPEIFTTLIWLYWSQSVLLGVFNFLDILTVRKVKPESVVINGRPGSLQKTPSAFFFLVHYGFFHLVYLFFISSMKPTGPFQLEFFKYFFFAFLAGQIITFVQHKIQQRKTLTNIGAMFFIPYLRIIPMHLTILLPALLHFGDMGIFLILKALADVAMYIVTRPAGSGKESNAALLAAQQIGSE